MKRAIEGEKTMFCSVPSVLIVLSFTLVLASPVPEESIDSGNSTQGLNCPKPCGNGVCDHNTGKCSCFSGWRGDVCSFCGGKVKLKGGEGWVADAIGNYTVDTKCTWLIEAPDDIKPSNIRLHLKEFATECGWDHLYIFDGDSVFSDLKAVYSGLVKSHGYSAQRVPEVFGTSGQLLLHFYSDVAYNATGFNITYSINSCPSDSHEQTCSGHGSCEPGGNCLCDEDFRGEACNLPACPKDCGSGSIKRGVCNIQEKRCDCFDGWAGEACVQQIEQGYWRPVDIQTEKKFQPPPRTSHVSMVDDSGNIWVVGGETFSHSRHMVATLTIEHDHRTGIIKGQWRTVAAKSEKGPSPRYGHSAVIYDNKIYMYGGTMRSGHISKELWSLDMITDRWERVETVKGRCMGSSSTPTLCGPIHSTGHTAVVQSNRMIVIFGHSPKYGYLDYVQEYHFRNKEWSVVPTSGYPVRGGFGHSAAWDPITKRIYVFGGYVSTANNNAAITNELYSYDPIIGRWALLSPPSDSIGATHRYLHSAVISEGMMIVFGGNTHNDTAWSHGAKCFSSDVLAYDINCDTWHNLQSTVPDMSTDLARFGHSAVMSNGTMIVYGGFNGVLKDDLLAYVPGKCSRFRQKAECLNTLIGVKCVWDPKVEECRPLQGLKSELDVCPNPEVDQSNFCGKMKTCQGCTSTSKNCVWCKDQCKWKTCGNNREGRLSSEFTGVDNFHGDEEDKFKGSKDVGKNEVKRPENCPALAKKKICEGHDICHSCVTEPFCIWQNDKNNRCKEKKKSSTGRSSGSGVLPIPVSKTRNSFESFNETVWKRMEEKLITLSQSGSPCSESCSEKKTCSDCTHDLCMWCKNLNICTDRNAYLASFPYGQCMDWTTQGSSCPTPPKDSGNDTKHVHMCSGYKTCETCGSNPACGWCDDGSNTGLGECLIGGASGPLVKTPKSSSGRVQWVAADTCSSTAGKTWHFTTCPDCQCNGHSTCLDGKTCRTPCRDHTVGKKCQTCASGYFGDPVNGGSCKRCECNGQAKTCNDKNGRCNCTTKGIIGDKCQKCDKSNHYSGDPISESCFCDLAIDYQFTFNLSKPDDKHLTAINFKNMPTKFDVDVDFSLTCSVGAKINVTVRYNVLHQLRENKITQEEEVIFSQQNCSIFKHRFSKDSFIFGSDENTTFYVYVYDFETPLWIIISFSQHPKLDLLQFFITFSVCFLALLLVAAILWKIKQKYDRYRRRQRLFVEMEQMASRPFGTVLVELEKQSDISSRQILQSPSTSSVGNSGSANPSVINISTSSDEIKSNHLRRRRRKIRPSPIALEPCLGNRAAVLSLIVKLPTGGKPYAPNGCTGMAVASSLVTLGNPRKPSVEPSSRQCSDDPKSGRKNRKNTNNSTVDI